MEFIAENKKIFSNHFGRFETKIHPQGHLTKMVFYFTWVRFNRDWKKLRHNGEEFRTRKNSLLTREPVKVSNAGFTK